jgi:hypothetical protein
MFDLAVQGEHKYTFENIAKVIDAFTLALKLHKFAIYIFDYGAPTGLRYVHHLLSFLPFVS